MPSPVSHVFRSLCKTRSSSLSTLTYLNESQNRKVPQNEPDEEIPIFDISGSGKCNKIRGYIWGGGQYGALGNEKILRPPKGKAKLYIKAPMQMHFAKKYEINKIACGYGFTLFASNNMVYGCGLNNNSQIGFHEARKNTGISLGFVLEPLPIKIPSKIKNCQIIKIAAGQNHSAILTSDGIYTLGNNEYGQCGRKVIPDENFNETFCYICYTRNNTTIHLLSQLDFPPIIDVVCSDNTTYFLTNTGIVYAFGQGTYGQIGNGQFEEINPEPSPVDILTNCGLKTSGDTGDHVIKVSSRSTTVLALTKEGRILAWGSGEHGQFSGCNDIYDVNSPSPQECNVSTPIPLDDVLRTALRLTYPAGNNSKERLLPTDIACTHSSCALVDQYSGSVYVWGVGLLGKGPNLRHANIPTLIPRALFSPSAVQDTSVLKSTVTSIHAGYSMFAAVTSDGGLYTWGQNRVGCLGLGHNDPQYFPFRVLLMCSSVAQVSLGYDHSAIIAKTLV